jgi:hypothetical protein
MNAYLMLVVLALLAQSASAQQPESACQFAILNLTVEVFIESVTLGDCVYKPSQAIPRRF